MKTSLQKIVKSRRVVIKVGTSLLSDSKMNLDRKSLSSVVENVLVARKMGKSAVLVTSGAVGAGMGKLGLKTRPKTSLEKQICAAVGQSLLMHEYERIFSESEVVTAQVLLTRNDIEDRRKHQNVRKVIEGLLEKNVLPIVNENDVVADDEIKFGDNDTLSGLVAEIIDAESLIILTDVDGLYGSIESKKIIPVVADIDSRLYEIAGGAGGENSVGGMITKLKVAEKMTRAGRITVNASGKRSDAVKKILSGENVGTLFLPSKKRIEARKRWIADQLISRGKIIVDAGAANALKNRGGSLLPKGIKGVSGSFVAGSPVEIVDESDLKIAQGLSAYSSRELGRIKGIRSDKIESVLGYTRGEEAIHRDNLVVFK